VFNSSMLMASTFSSFMASPVIPPLSDSVHNCW
jgi:hypothetical protein